MPTSPSAWVDFKAVKERVSILQVIERYGLLASLKKSASGDRLSGPCPIHKGANQTHFRVSASKNCFNCFGCNASGNQIDFVRHAEGVDFRAAAQLIQKWFLGETHPPKQGGAPPEARRKEVLPETGDPKPPVQEPAEEEREEPSDAAENPPLKFELTKLDPAHPYLRQRGLSDETVAAFGVGHCGRGLMRGYACIPVHNRDGELVAYAGRWPGTPEEGKGKYKLPAGFRKSLELFNQHRAAASGAPAPLVVVEGYFDAMRLHQAGYEKVVALMGSSLSARQEERLRAICEADGRLILFFDNDEAGRKGQSDALARLAKGLYVRAVDLGSRETQPESLSPEELRSVLPFPERSAE